MREEDACRSDVCVAPPPESWTEVQSRLEMICGWLSHLDARLTAIERQLEAQSRWLERQSLLEPCEEL